MTLENLYSLFRWFDMPSGGFPIIDLISSSQDEIVALAKESKRRLESAPTDIELKIDKFLLQQIEKDEPFNLYKASLNWLIDSYHSFSSKKIQQIRCQTKISVVYHLFLEKMSEEAISYYQNEPKLIEIYPAGTHLIRAYQDQIKSDEGLVKVESTIKFFSEKLERIKEPLSLNPCIDYNDTHVLAAYIVWLIRRGINEEAIFGSGMLQTFFMINLHLLNQDNNPIVSFYQYLENYDETAKLLAQASLLRVESDVFEKYNLKGQLCFETSLASVPITNPPLLKDYDQLLFTNLYTLFGLSFLSFAFTNAYERQVDVDVLILALNSGGTAIHELLKLQLNSDEGDTLNVRLNFLASLTKTITVQTTLETDNQWVILHLLPYKGKELESLFTHKAFVCYIEDFLNRTDVDSLSKFRLLYHLLLWSKEEGNLVKQHFLYQQLAALLFSPPFDLLNQNKFIKILKNEYHALVIEPEETSETSETSDESSATESSDDYSGYGVNEDSEQDQRERQVNQPVQNNHRDLSESSDSFEEPAFDETIYRIDTQQCLEKIQAIYENQWQALITKLLGKELFEREDYLYLREKWNIYEQKQYALRRIFNLEAEEEKTLAELIIVKRFLLKGDDFVLDEVLTILFDDSNESEMLKCQQILVAILLRNTLPLLTAKLIESLSTVNRHWFLIDWRKNNLSLLEEAVLNNNMSLCIYLLRLSNDFPSNPDVLFQSLKVAIEKSNLALCKLFLTSSIISKFNQNQHVSLLIDAMLKGGTNVFDYFIKKRELFNFTQSQLKSLILLAATHGVVSALLVLMNPLNKLIPSEFAVDQALINAAEGMNWVFIEQLLEFAEPRSPAFVLAWRDVVQRAPWSGQLRFIRICDDYFTNAMVWASIYRYIELNFLEGIIFFIKRRGSGEFSATDLVALFRVALSKGTWGMAILDVLIKIEGPRALSRESISQAILELIVADSDSKTLKYIYRNFPPNLLPDAQTVKQLFENACRNHSLEIKNVLIFYAAKHLNPFPTNRKIIGENVTESPASIEYVSHSLYNAGASNVQNKVTLMPASRKIAKWPPQKITADKEHANQRIYWYADGSEIPGNLSGKYLPSAEVARGFQRLAPDLKAEHLESTKLFTNLPAKFYQVYLSIQASSNPINLPKIKQNKNTSVRSCFEQHSSFATRRGRLHPSHWKELGWPSQQAYINWLNTSMLFAFSHCNHYTSTTRLIDAFQTRNSEEQAPTFHFKQYSQQELENKPKTTNIFSVTGYEFRGFREQGRVTIRSTIPAIQHHTQLTMNQILQVAEETETTDIVLIPFGMGVFIKGLREEPEIRAAMMAGMIESLKAYRGRPVTIHSCGWPDFYTQLASVKNPAIRFIDSTGNDAYIVANSIQDRGDEEELEIIPEVFGDRYETRPLKSMLINAGDNDWNALLDNTKMPGQFFFGHSLYHSTSDEYYALVTDFACHSIQNLINAFGNLFNTNKIKQLNIGTATAFESSLSMEQIEKIDQLKTKLQREYNSCWPYLNKDRKRNKFQGLELLITSAETMTIHEAVRVATSAYPDLLLGEVSTRTADLIEELVNSAGYSLVYA